MLMWTPSRATLTIIGLYNYNEDLFDNLSLPADIDGDLVVNCILVECGELELRYPDWDFMYNQIGAWSALNMPIWERFLRAVNEEYNPLENYDRKESRTRSAEQQHTENAAAQEANSVTANDVAQRSAVTDSTGTGSRTGNEAQSDRTLEDRDLSSDNDTTTTTHGNDTAAGRSLEDRDLSSDNDVTTTNSVAGFNASTLVNQNQSVVDGTTTDTGTVETTTNSTNSTETETTVDGTVTDSGTVETTRNALKENTESTENADHSEASETNTAQRTEDGNRNRSEQRAGSGKENETETSHIHGNIGVTTSQQMLAAELDLLPRINFVNYVVNQFKHDFCIVVY